MARAARAYTVCAISKDESPMLEHVVFFGTALTLSGFLYYLDQTARFAAKLKHPVLVCFAVSIAVFAAFWLAWTTGVADDVVVGILLAFVIYPWLRSCFRQRENFPVGSKEEIEAWKVEHEGTERRFQLLTVVIGV